MASNAAVVFFILVNCAPFKFPAAVFGNFSFYSANLKGSLSLTPPWYYGMIPAVLLKAVADDSGVLCGITWIGNF